MRTDIPPLADDLYDEIQAAIDAKTKPLGALGQLENIARQVCLIQESLTPSLSKPHLLVFAADHGVADEKVSAYPQSVSAQMVENFLNGGAAINVFTRQHDLNFKLIDAGVNHTFAPHPDLIDAKVAMGTRNFATTPAMTAAQCQQAIDGGAKVMTEVIAEGCNVVGFGEMGIANTAAASALMASITGLAVDACVGRGTGLADAGLAHKKSVIANALALHGLSQQTDPLQSLATVGGFEIAMLVGAMFTAAQHKCVMIIDGFIVTSALLVAHAINPAIKNYCLFAHCSDESPHRALLDYLQAEPILSMGLRLGEGTGAALAYPLVESAVRFFNEMATFDSANVSQQS